MTAWEIKGEEVIGLPGQNLSHVELRALVSLADGVPTAKVARMLSIADAGMREIERAIQAKLGAKNKAHMITRGFTLGVLIPQALCLMLCVISALEIDHDAFRVRSQRRSRSTGDSTRMVRTSPSASGNGRPCSVSFV